jgi:hypothetical protein
MCHLNHANKKATGKSVDEKSTKDHPGTRGKFSRMYYFQYFTALLFINLLGRRECMGESDGNTYVCDSGEGMEYHKLDLFDSFHVR